MGMRIEESDLNSILKTELEKIFENKNFSDLSNFQRRKCVFDYLVENSEYDFSLLNDIYSRKKQEYADEIVSVLNPKGNKKGVCNSFSYAYKLLLDKLQIPCMLVICHIAEDSVKDFQNKGVNTNTSMIVKTSSGLYMIPHMLVLVQNDDGTFSFDDITYAIFNKENERKKEFFNYNSQMAKQNKQLNPEGFDTFMLRFIVNNSKDKNYDMLFREKYEKKTGSGVLNIPFDLIKSYEEPNKIEATKETRE